MLTEVRKPARNYRSGVFQENKNKTQYEKAKVNNGIGVDKYDGIRGKGRKRILKKINYTNDF